MLVVDDDARNRKLLVGYLEAEGHEVREAADGASSLRLASESPPDVVLLDVMMPGMTGYEVCAALKADPETRLCQVMLVTALDSTPDKVEGLDIGADDYVTKPVRREEFLAKVRALLRVRRVLVDLELARATLARRNEELELKRTLAQTLVHDLKSPLAAILGNLDLLEMRGGDRIGSIVERSKRGALRMQQMILDLLDVERLEQGRLEPNIAAHDVGRLVRDGVEEARATGTAHGVRIEAVDHGEALAACDASLIRRVLDNLLANAIVHSPRETTVRAGARLRDEGVELYVDDEGTGIPPEHRERVFEKYAQLHLRTSGVSTNRGLGLTFCRLVVEAHGGTIWIEAAPGGGASFRTLLPASDAGEPRREPACVVGRDSSDAFRDMPPTS